MVSRSPAAVDANGHGKRKLRRGPLTRQQILDASLRLFSDRGFARTSVRDIAQAAGITDAAIYYHFDSKRDLFEALVEERGFNTALENLERAEVTESGFSPREAVVGLATSALEFIYQNKDVMKVLMLEALSEDPVAAEEYRILVDRWQRGLAGILRQYADRGLLRTEAVDELAAQISLTVIGAFADYMMTPAETRPEHTPPQDLHRHVEIAMQHVVQGIT
ncbi:MAG: TetR family transcriptional regulator [Chloroflexi bacterium]|nr:TetR family transcriptional regulator [Chloroflexota bacterium]